MALTQITEKGIKDGEIINADINASAAIAKSKIETFVTNNADNRVITGSGTANTLNGESNLTYDGSNFQFNTTANGNAVKLVATGNHYNKLSFDSNASSAGGSLAFIDFSWDGDKVADIIAVAGSDTTNKDDGHLSFRTSPSQGSIAERMRIDSSGNVGIGVTPTMAAGGGLHVRGPSGHQARLHMTTSNSGDTGNDGFYIIQQGAESTSNDTNFINYETANMKFSTSGSERMRIDSSGNVGIGTASPNRNLTVSDATNAIISVQNSGASTEGVFNAPSGGTINLGTTGSHVLTFSINSSEKMRLDTSGNLLHGVTANEDTTGHSGTKLITAGDIQIDGNAKALVFRAGSGAIQLESGIQWWNENGAGVQAKIHCDRTSTTYAKSDLVFYTSANVDTAANSGQGDITERMRITSGGHVYAIGAAGGYISNTGAYHQFINTGNGQWTMQIKQEHHNGMNTQLLVNSTTNIEAFQIYSTSNNTTRFRVLNNGNCANANNSFGSLSDVKLKENIVDASSQWDDVKAVKVRNFNFKNDKDSKLLGVVAQEVETVSSGLVFETIDRDPDDSTKEIGTTKNVKYSILYMKAFKALQEAMAKIEVLETEVTALKAA